MKLRQRLFLRRFLPIWGTIGILFSLVVTISFGIENIYQILMLVGISVFCALLSATNAWNYCLMLDWIALSLNMAGRKFNIELQFLVRRSLIIYT